MNRTKAKAWKRWPMGQEMAVLRALRKEGPRGTMRGIEIREAAKLPNNHVYVLLRRLRSFGAVDHARIIDTPQGRVPLWRITAWGRATCKAMDELEAARG